MARPKLYDSSQPFIVRTLLWLYEFLASLKLAVILIFALAFVLAYATFVEAHLGTKAVQWYLYHSGWFAALLALLAINVFCAAAIRYPWKRHQTGFVVTHIGLLTLLAGSAISFMGSLNSQMLVFLNGSSQMAIDLDENGFLQIDGLPDHPETVTQTLQLGPFNWNSYHDQPLSHKVATRFGLTDETWQHQPIPVYESDDYTVEVIDYYSASEVHYLPYLDLSFTQSVIGSSVPIELEWKSDLPFAQTDFMGMGSLLLWKTQDSKDLERFKMCRPQRVVEGDGAIVVWSDGEPYHFSVSQLKQIKEDGEEPEELDSGIKIELGGYAPTVDLQKLMSTGQFTSSSERVDMPAVELVVTEPAKEGEEPKVHRMVRLAQFPIDTVRSKPDDFYVEYYHPEMKGRIDLLLGPEGNIAYRVWQKGPKLVVTQGDLKENEPVETWSMGGGQNVWSMTMNRFLPREQADKPWDVFPVQFSKDSNGQSKRIKVRVTWKTESGTDSDEFWLGQNLPEPWVTKGSGQIHRTTMNDGKAVSISYNAKQTDVGFAMKLVDFDLDVDPGTSMAANYTSFLVQLDVRQHEEIVALQEKLDAESDAGERQKLRLKLADKRDELFTKLYEEYDALPADKRAEWIESHDEAESHIVTMNEPLDYPDLEGRPLRFFQENYLPPDPRSGTDYGSIFRVNYDPGRAVKYLGSALITFGIFLMFYMRAYFFKKIPRANQTRTKTEDEKPSSTVPEKASV